jgi:hypothetical protein
MEEATGNCVKHSESWLYLYSMYGKLISLEAGNFEKGCSYEHWHQNSGGPYPYVLLSLKMYTQVHFKNWEIMVKLPDIEYNHSPPSSSEVSLYLHVPYSFVPRHKENFFFPFFFRCTTFFFNLWYVLISFLDHLWVWKYIHFGELLIFGILICDHILLIFVFW